MEIGKDIFYAPFSDQTREFLKLGNYHAIIDLIDLCRIGCMDPYLIQKYNVEDENGNTQLNNIIDEIRWILVMNNFI